VRTNLGSYVADMSHGATMRASLARRRVVGSHAVRSSAGGAFARRPGFSPVMRFAVTAPTSSVNAAGRAAAENSVRHCNHAANSDWRSKPTPSAAWPRRRGRLEAGRRPLLGAAEQGMRYAARHRRERHRTVLAKLGAQLRSVAIAARRALLEDLLLGDAVVA
jgi:hypothetical protein